MPKTLLYVLANFPVYSETFVLNEMLELNKRNYHILIFSLKTPREKIMQKEVEVFLDDTTYCPVLFKINLFKAQAFFLLHSPRVYLSLLANIIRRCLKNPEALLNNLGIFPKSVYYAYHIKDRAVDHIHAHFAHYSASSALIISKLLGIPFSFTCHAHDIFYDTTMLDFKIMNSKCCFAISEYNRNYILGVYPYLPKEKITVLHCGINLDKFTMFKSKADSEKLRILSVGRLMPTKGFDDLIRSCRILKDLSLDFSCQIIGDGPMEKELKNLIKDLDLGASVELPGPLLQEEIADIYKKADVFVLASKKAQHHDVQDGIPVVLMEAMASGAVVVSTRVSGIPELVNDGRTGVLVDAGDVQGLAQAIIKIDSSLALCEELKKNAKDKVYREFNIRFCVDQLERMIFRECI
jgi:glycosyltransferase involved in cell wall biosynthesis